VKPWSQSLALQKQNKTKNWVPVAQAYNPSYLEG
jgi:hypothetical protein